MNINTGHFIKLLKYYKSISVIAVVMVFSLLPADNADKILFIDFPHIDKIIHFFMYLILSLILLIDIHLYKKKPTSFYTLSVLTFILIFSGIIEIIQEVFILSRSGSFYDFAANLTGIILGYILYKKRRFFFKH